MEHDLVRDILAEKIGKVDGRIHNYRSDITKLEASIALEREFYEGGSTKSYFVCKSRTEGMATKEKEWCEENMGYSPICMFVEKDSNRTGDPVRMVVLFKDDEDLSAYKIMFS